MTQAISDSSLLDTGPLCPFAYRQCLAKCCDFNRSFERSCRALIVLLLDIERPTAVVRRVAFIVVDAIQRMVGRRPIAHVRDKCSDIIPSLANGDAPTAVVLEGVIVRVRTPPMHMHPCRIERMPTESVSKRSGEQQFARQTTTGSRLTTLEMIRGNQLFISASAATDVKPPPGSRVLMVGHDSPSIEDVSWMDWCRSYASTRFGAAITEFLAVNDTRRTTATALTKPTRASLFRWLVAKNGKFAERLSGQINHDPTIAHFNPGVATG